ncbi:MAG TPA: amidohydrolase family protein [Chthonomonadaceae bacterium]|nr:amidohydrolase family protein [Chthonomonadaceae bacterium]
MILDVNGYYGSWPYWPLLNGDPDAMLAKMDKYGIMRVYLSSLKAVFSDVERGNAEMLALVRQHPARFAPAFTYTPYAAGKERYREELLSVERRLVKLFPIPQGYEPLEEPYIAELLDFCGQHDIPVLIPHRLLMSWRFPRYDVQKIGALARQHPDTQFIIGAVNYVLELQSALDVMRRNPNVFIETSAMMALREIEQVAAHIGAERMLHGSAIPLQNPAIGPLKIQTADIPDADKERIFFRNAAERLRL